jgi:hypothetical protein
MPAIAAPRRRLRQQVEIVRVRKRERLVGRELPLGRQILEQFSHLAIIHDQRPMAAGPAPRSFVAVPDRLESGRLDERLRWKAVTVSRAPANP